MESDLETLPLSEDAPELGVIVRDKVLPGNIRYPADYYGFVPSTVSVDGEPSDAVVFAYDPVFPGCMVKARVIGALEVFENENAEYNTFAFPDDDPRFDDIEVLEDLPQQNLRDLEQVVITFRQLEGTRRRK